MKNFYGLFISCLYLTCCLLHFSGPAIILDVEYKRNRSALYNCHSCFVSSLPISPTVLLSTVLKCPSSAFSPLDMTHPCKRAFQFIFIGIKQNTLAVQYVCTLLFYIMLPPAYSTFFLLLHRACCYNYCLIQLMHLHIV